jgi:hypothetical protein
MRGNARRVLLLRVDIGVRPAPAVGCFRMSVEKRNPPPEGGRFYQPAGRRSAETSY